MNPDENTTPNQPQDSIGQQRTDPQVGMQPSPPAPVYGAPTNVAQPAGPQQGPTAAMDDTISPETTVVTPPVQPVASTEGFAPSPQQSEPVNSPTSVASSVPSQPTATDPGQTMGIIGLILAFLFAPLGLILSMIAYSKSKKAGHKNVVALVGIILSIVGTLLFALLVMLTVASTARLQENAKKVQLENAQSQQQAEQETERLQTEVVNPEAQLDVPATE